LVIPADGRGLAIQLASVADKCSANLVVMGAYGRGIARELLFGSQTEALLRYRQADPLDALERSRRPISGTHHRDRTQP
jgi:hypothetical protein